MRHIKSVIFEQVKETMQQHPIGEILTTSQIKNEVNARFGANRSSVIPSDYCYNRVNKGIDFSRGHWLFIYAGRGKYKYVGEKRDA